MARDASNRMEPKIRRLPTKRRLSEADVLRPALRLERDSRLEISYAPLDWLRPTARIAIVGITPGKATMLIAYQTLVDGLAAGRGAASVLDSVKAAAPFSGFRAQLVTWLEHLNVHTHLGLESAARLWTSDGQRSVHPTSAVRYPVLIGGKNDNGTSPSLSRHPILSAYIDEQPAPELARIPDALVVPLGLRVDDAIARLIESDRLDGARCVVGFPHPSGANGRAMRTLASN